MVKGNRISLLIFLLSLQVGCTAAASSGQEPPGRTDTVLLVLPTVHEIDLNEDGRLKVLATTGIIGDVLSQVGGRYIYLTVLMEPGQDPHSFEPSAGDLAAASEAQMIFVNGWDLEEGLIDDLANTAKDTAIVPISAGVAPIFRGDSDETGRQPADPHVWMDPHLVKQWATNSSIIFSSLDPANAPAYADNLDSYLNQLDELIIYIEEQVAAVPPEVRQLVTNHDSLAYFTSAFGFKIIGTIIPEVSTLAEPSASALATLISDMEEVGLCAIFSESTVSSDLAQTAAQELDSCDEVQVINLYTGALGPEGSGAESYIGMMRANIDSIVKGISLSNK